MNDLKKMQEEFEEKFKNAKQANLLESRYGVEFYIFTVGRLGTGSKHVSVLKTIEPKQAQAILCDFEPNGLILCGPYKKEFFTKYRITVERGLNDKYTKLRIEWRVDGDSFSVVMDAADAVFNEFLHDETRKADTHEITTYRPIKNGRLVRDIDVPIRTFNAAHIEHIGGHHLLSDIVEAGNIVETIKNLA